MEGRDLLAAPLHGPGLARASRTLWVRAADLDSLVDFGRVREIKGKSVGNRFRLLLSRWPQPQRSGKSPGLLCI